MKPKRAIDVQSLFFYIFFSVPLLYIFDYPAISRTIRFSVLFGLLLLVFCIKSSRHIFLRNLQNLNRFTKLGTGIILAMLLLSTVFAQNGWQVALFGVGPEYLGLLSWLAFMVLGVFFHDRMKQLLTHKAALGLSLLIITLSLISNYYEITHGLRLSGLILQATTMGMHAVFVSIIGFWQLRIATEKSHKLWACILVILSTIVVILTQSRIAAIAFVIAYGALALRSILGHKRRLHLALFATVLFCIVALIPQISTHYFARFQTDSLGSGISYRLELYRLTARDVLANSKIIGSGPGSLPQSINDESAVPEDIQLSLRVGDVFLSSHNMYLDIAYCFGLLTALVVLILSLYALGRNGIHAFELTLLFIVSVLNALVNVTSLEFTSWYFVLLFALISSPSKPLKRNA